MSLQQQTPGGGGNQRGAIGGSADAMTNILNQPTNPINSYKSSLAQPAQVPSPPLDQQKLNEKIALLEILSSGTTKTFDQCIQQFNMKFVRTQWFKICCDICYLLEANLLTKSQRIVAFYILYKVYNSESFKVTPFESVVLSSINHCTQIFQTKPDSFEAFERRAEYQLLTDFVVSTPKIANKNVNEYIKQIELQAQTQMLHGQVAATGQSPANVGGTKQDDDAGSAPFIPVADIKEHIKIHKESMPQITGPKAFALSIPVVVDQPDVPDNFAYGQCLSGTQSASPAASGSVAKTTAQSATGQTAAPAGNSSSSSQSVHMNVALPDIFPEFEISASDDLTDNELQPHFFNPDFLRPLPQPCNEDNIDDEDFDDAYWLIPGMVPEPYWDINMGQEFNYAQLKFYLNKALKTPLSTRETEHIQRAFRNDQEIVLHVGMAPHKLADLIIHNLTIAQELLVCMTHTNEIHKYYDALKDIKISANSLEVFSKISQTVELPHEYIQTYLNKQIDECRSIQDQKGQKRVVRILSLFLQSLIKAKITFFNQEMLNTIKQFCIDFSKVQDVNNLHKLVSTDLYMKSQQS